ncbi:MAG TPA: hypothetical protein VGO90_13330 [Chthoniobacteraceae bacterium]|nr:hypothetical protein [Chthoniobacteraceae bacterium]
MFEVLALHWRLLLSESGCREEESESENAPPREGLHAVQCLAKAPQMHPKNVAWDVVQTARRTVV